MAGLPLVIGAGLTLSYSPYGLWFLAPVLLALALYLIRHSARPHLSAWCFGLGWFGAGISWVHVSIADFGGLPLLGSVALMALLAAYLALYPLLAVAMAPRLTPRLPWPLGLALCWPLAEALRGHLLTGFPWLSLGYAQLDSPLAGWFPVIGEIGVSSLLMLGVAGALYYLEQKRWHGALLVVVVLYGSGALLQNIAWVTPKTQQASITLVQGNIPQSLRWDPNEHARTMGKYQRLSQPHWQTDIMIWPEAAVPELEILAQDYLYAMEQQALAGNSALVTGVVDYNYETERAFNSLIVLGSTDQSPPRPYRYGHSNRYSKHHLLPIGEFIPLEDWLRGLAPLFDLPMSSFSRGDYRQPNIQAKGYHLAPAICFEIAFAEQIRQNLTRDTDFILTVSNDAWFGRSHGPHQHMQIARARALEFGIPVIRATNNGISGIVDHKGQLVARLPQFQAGVLDYALSPTMGATPYGRFGNWPLWCLMAVVFIWQWLSYRANRNV